VHNDEHQVRGRVKAAAADNEGYVKL